MQTACRAIDAYYITTTSLVSGILVSADKVMVDNAEKYGIEAYYILDTNNYNKLIQSLRRLKEHGFRISDEIINEVLKRLK